MLAFLFATVAFVMANAYAATSNDVEIRKTHVTLPQCGNLTLSWSSGVAPYIAVITDVTTGASYVVFSEAIMSKFYLVSEACCLVPFFGHSRDTITSEENSLTWTINMPIFTKVSFVVTDAKNTISGSGPVGSKHLWIRLIDVFAHCLVTSYSTGSCGAEKPRAYAVVTRSAKWMNRAR